MTKKKQVSLIEAASQMLGEKVVTGGGATGQAQGPEIVAVAGGGSHKNRPQDKLGADPMPKAQNPAGTPIESTPTVNNVSPTGDNSGKNRASVAMKAVREDVDAMFAGLDDVSEEFKTKATTIFEAAVAARVEAVKGELDEQAASQVSEAVALVQEDLTTKIDEYLTYVVEQWMEANELAVEQGLRADIAESFMKGLQNLFTEHYISIPDEQVDAVAEMAEQINKLEESLNAAVNQNVELLKKVNEAARASAIEEVTEGLVETTKAKLGNLFDNVEFTTVEEFKAKLQTIKEGYVATGTTGTKKSGIKNLLEQVEEVAADDKPAGPKSNDPAVNAYVDAISRSLRT